MLFHLLFDTDVTVHEAAVVCQSVALQMSFCLLNLPRESVLTRCLCVQGVVCGPLVDFAAAQKLLWDGFVDSVLMGMCAFAKTYEVVCLVSGCRP